MAILYFASSECLVVMTEEQLETCNFYIMKYMTRLETVGVAPVHIQVPEGNSKSAPKCYTRRTSSYLSS